MNNNVIFSNKLKEYLNCIFLPNNIDDFIYFKNKKKKFIKIENLNKKRNYDFLMYYPKCLKERFMKMPNGRKLVIFIMMSFISYLMLVISHLLKNKEKKQLESNNEN